MWEAQPVLLRAPPSRSSGISDRCGRASRVAIWRAVISNRLSIGNGCLKRSFQHTLATLGRFTRKIGEHSGSVIKFCMVLRTCHAEDVEMNVAGSYS